MWATLRCTLVVSCPFNFSKLVQTGLIAIINLDFCRSGLLDICQEILESVADKNPRNEDGTTPLHDAAIEGHLDIVRLILDNVQEKNPPDEESHDTPLHFAGTASASAY